jgi:hypothetical protein
MWQSLGFTAQFALGIVRPKDVALQATILAPLLLVALTCVWLLNRYVQPLDTPAGATRIVSRDDDNGDEHGSD